MTRGSQPPVEADSPRHMGKRFGPGLLREVLAFSVLAVAIFAPRIVALDRFVTADEPLWVRRSANFYRALSQGEYAHTFQKEHPGVTIMWAGAAGLLWRFPEYGTVGTSQVETRGFDLILAEHGQEILELLAAGRFFLVLAQTVVLLLAYVFARGALGLASALVGIAFVAFDPFHIAHSRLLHLDGLLSSLLLLALLAFLDYLSGRHVPALVISGAAAGLSFITKYPGIMIVPTVGLLALLDLLQRLKAQAGTPAVRLLWQNAWPLLVWGGVMVSVLILLWPAMWVDPVGILSKLANSASATAEGGHESPVFFDGQVVRNGRLGIGFYRFYPTTYLWRTTPVILMGLLAAMASFVFKRKPLAQPAARSIVLGLVLFALIFTGAMTLGSKKSDRYLLPAYPPLDLVAATGWVAMAHWLGSRHLPLVRRYGAPALLIAAIAVPVTLTLRTYPYYLTYYNPLMGGIRKAPDVMMIGWGEGLDEAARYLNKKPNASELTVASWYPDTFSAVFDGTTRSVATRSELLEKRLHKLLDSDYIVVYIHQWQRQIPWAMLERLSQRTPEHTIWIAGLEYARIYTRVGYQERDSIHFEADDNSLPSGGCTWLRWEVDFVREVYVDGEGVAGHDQRLVCPNATTVYELRVVHVDGSETQETVQVAVQD